MEDCHIRDKTTVPDGYGGVITKYVDGAPIKAAFAFDMSTQGRIANVQGATDTCTITTRKSVVLQSGDVIRRDKDGMIFLITTNGGDYMTPESADLNSRAVKAKVWKEPVKGGANG
jgi:hypothetical protein